MKEIFTSVIVSLLTSIIFTPFIIRFFTRRGWGQEIRVDGPKSHHLKRGKPSMGGVAILGALWFGYLAGHLFGNSFTASGLLVLGLATGLGVIGFLDDFIKINQRRNLGLTKKTKFFGQCIVAVLFALGALTFKNDAGITPGSRHLSFIHDIAKYTFPVWFFVLFVWLVVSSWSNAVNFTDGLDGLVGGTAAMVFGCYVIILEWQFRASCSVLKSTQHCFLVRDPHDLAMVTASASAACLGFLWWNAAPAKIFMGDTGSLAIGGLVAGISVVSSTELLMIVIGSLFVIEMLSDIIQIGVFRTTGKRVFKMAPFHHHFELSGWAETTVTIRFWLLSAISCGAGIGLFYAYF